MKKVLCFLQITEAAKGNELNQNSKAALLFYWDHLQRQVRIEGTVIRVSTEESKVFLNLLSSEFMSKGGNIRDLTIDDLSFLATKGQVWIAYDKDILVSGITLQPFIGSSGDWWYFNNAVTLQNYRGQGIVEKLVSSVTQTQPLESNYFVLTVTKGPFLRNGFNIVTVPELALLDETNAQIAAKKIRPDNPATICIRTGFNQT